jgi:predicted RNase H-like nuclease
MRDDVRPVGIDGCGGRQWIVAEQSARTLTFTVTSDLAPLWREAQDGRACIVIDMPIGLSVGPRACDQAARDRIGAERQSSVFRPPTRAAFGASEHRTASDANCAACGKRLSVQAFGILWRIEQIDQMMTPHLQAHIHEGHPEVTFAVLAGAPMRFPKLTSEGLAERLQVLRRFGLDLDVAAERLRLGRGHVGADDLVDAAACLITARRIAQGTAEHLPRFDEGPDERGLMMRITA